MNMRESEFWNQLKRITALDDHVEVPASTLEHALRLFQPPERLSLRSRIFALRPAFTGAVRRADTERKLFYQLDEQHIVQLEKSWDEEGVNLSGFVHGFDEVPVVLYGQECVFETKIEAGGFELRALPKGSYHLAFSVEGEDFWIRDLDLT